MDCNKEEAIKAEEMMGNNRKKTSTESSENCEVSAHLPGQNFQCVNEENRLRSTRHRQRVNYCDNLSDEDEEEEASKRYKGVGYLSPTKESEVQHLSHAETPSGEEKKLKDSLSSEESLQNTEMEIETTKGSVDVGPSTMTESKIFEYADPDFSDFHMDESCFKVGQVWAVYDTLDAMPRFYAVIRKILSPAFKLRITWLEPEPRNEDETKWLSKGFPASCGKFRLGNSEDTEDDLMFLHLVCAINGNNYDAIKIFPLKGETWALFKDWDMNWHTNLGSDKKFNYEFVEVLSDYVDAIGVLVAYLNKATGFTCLFHRVGDPFLVPAKDMFRFSHRIPSMKLTGMERDDVPEGSFELNPASLPTDQVGVSASSIDQRVTATKESEVQHLSHAATPNGEENKLKDSLSSEESLQNTEMEIETTKGGVDVGPSTITESKTFECADPDFSDFDKDESCFKVGQVWAVYDTLDAMPRFYAVIRKILSPAFKLRITWLEPEPLNEDETKWLSEGFPASCGRFRLGNSEDIEDHPMFSHLVCAINRNSYGAIKIFPLEGETWAIFKDWDMNWCSHLESNKKFNYEFVEVLSDYVDAIGVLVAYLNKAKVFTCLFHRAGDPFLVPAKDMLRFSHRVPSIKMTGMERDDVLEGSFELDPASLPTDQVGVSASSIDQRATANFIDSVNSAENLAASVANQVPEPEFYRFAAERSPEKFQIGQCWAIYSDEDGLPRYYGQIKKIDRLPEFVLHVAWFYACPLPKSTIQWHDKTMPIGCGLFKFRNSELNKYTVTNNFSHVVTAEPVKRGVYKIFPRKGEVWGVYKNWSPQLKGNNLEDFEYEIVEIVDVSDNSVDVKFLMWVKGFKSVYKPRVEEQEETDGVLKICVSQHLRFSHRIPAFCLTEERGGSLRGFWELDPAGMPLYLLSTD